MAAGSPHLYRRDTTTSTVRGWMDEHSMILPSRLLCMDPKLTELFVEALKEFGEEDLLLFLVDVDALRFSSSEHAERQFFRIARTYLASETGNVISRLAHSTASNIVKALETGVGIRCVFAVATERIWQYLVCEAMNSIQMCDAYAEVRALVLDTSRPTVEDILDHASYLDVLMGAAELQTAEFEMPALECWRDCRSIITDAQFVSTVHNRLELLLNFVRQAYTTYVCQQPAVYVKQSTRLELGQSLQRLAAIRNVKELDEDQSRHMCNSLLSLIRCLQLESYAYIQNELFPAFIHQTGYFEIACSLYCAHTSAINAYLKRHWALLATPWDSCAVARMKDGVRFVKYAPNPMNGSWVQSASVVAISFDLNSVNLVNPDTITSPRVDSLEMKKWTVISAARDIATEETPEEQSSQFLDAILVKQWDSFTQILTDEISLLGQHVLKRPQTVSNICVNLVGKFPELFEVLDELAVFEEDSASVSSYSIGDIDFHGDTGTPVLGDNALLHMALHITPHKSQPDRAHVTLVVSRAPFLNSLRKLAAECASGSQAMSIETATSFQDALYLHPGVSRSGPSIIDMMAEASFPSDLLSYKSHAFPYVDAPLQLLVRSIPPCTLVHALLLCISGRNVIFKSVSTSLLSMALEILPVLCWPLTSRQEKAMVTSAEQLEAVLLDTSIKRLQSLRELKEHRTNSPTMISSPSSAFRPTVALPTDESPISAVRATKFLLGMQTSTYKAIFTFEKSLLRQNSKRSLSLRLDTGEKVVSESESYSKPAPNIIRETASVVVDSNRTAELPQNSTFAPKKDQYFQQEPPRSRHRLSQLSVNTDKFDAISAILAEAFVVDLDTCIVTPPVLDDGLGFVPSSLAGYAELCEALRTASASAEVGREASLELNFRIQEAVYVFVKGLILSHVGVYVDQYPAERVVSFNEISFLESVDERFRHFYHKVVRSEAFGTFLAMQGMALHTEDVSVLGLFCEEEIMKLMRVYA